MTRINFLIDGFNLYHSCRAAQKLIGATTKWLNVKDLLYSYHSVYKGVAKDDIQFGDIFYFSAFAYHRIPNDPHVVNRHRAIINCFADSGIIIEVNDFKEKPCKCPDCGHQWIKHEEKETDVSIGVKLIELFHLNACDMVVIVSGDTDLAPAVRTAKNLFSKKVVFAFPFARKNEYLKALAPESFKLNGKAYLSHQFPDPYTCKDGKIIYKPKTW